MKLSGVGVGALVGLIGFLVLWDSGMRNFCVLLLLWFVSISYLVTGYLLKQNMLLVATTAVC